ncbi:hypothetical protein THOG11_120111 [Vibrio harveyi]|nr:hypothetical protein VCHENC01_5114 [Vibrio harveyi]CAH1223775.1 hypothetical protein TH15OA1_410113 [Vibrio harveyi]CAH1548331.1 hypothetical protein THOD03_110111 [Vibrio harveyi]CAH1552689.1 hypothetical protein THOG11_120111 [Vibrio harveyi]
MSFLREVLGISVQQTFYSSDNAKNGWLNYFDKKSNKTLTLP